MAVLTATLMMTRIGTITYDDAHDNGDDNDDTDASTGYLVGGFF